MEDGIEIKIDRNTLPKDYQKIEFELEDGTIKQGEFIEGDDMFVVSPSEFYRCWIVVQWKALKDSDE